MKQSKQELLEDGDEKEWDIDMNLDEYFVSPRKNFFNTDVFDNYWRKFWDSFEHSYTTNSILVDRYNILDEAINGISDIPFEELSHFLQVTFKGEYGFDAGGLRREFSHW